jgi:hypothetical protein
MKKIIYLLVMLFLIQRVSFSQAEMLFDSEGNRYKTIMIGNQLWMAENLRTTTLNDGTKIKYVTDKLAWSKLSIPAYCWDNNDESEKNMQNGALYNWYTVETGKLCPTGWHLPSDRIGTNEPYITAGYRDQNGSFWSGPGQTFTLIWTSTECSLLQAYYIVVSVDHSQAQRSFGDKKYGITVRCVKDSK